MAAGLEVLDFLAFSVFSTLLLLRLLVVLVRCAIASPAPASNRINAKTRLSPVLCNCFVMCPLCPWRTLGQRTRQSRATLLRCVTGLT